MAQQREIAEMQSKLMLARMNPRDEKEVVDRIIMSCTRQSLAETAMYTYARGGTSITGPSIRLAEVIAQQWGNFDFGVRELEQRDGESTVEAYAWDLQHNVSQRKIFQVAHVRATKSKGNVRLTDPRDIYELVANNGARRLRACILGVIPGDVVETAVRQCATTLQVKVTVNAERIASILDGFAAYGVTKAQIERRIQRHMEAITPALVVNLGNIYNSLKDGMSSPGDWFEAEGAPASHGTVDLDSIRPGSENRGHGAENLDKAAGNKAKAPQPAPAGKTPVSNPKKEVVDEITGEVTPAPGGELSDAQWDAVAKGGDPFKDDADLFGGDK